MSSASPTVQCCDSPSRARQLFMSTHRNVNLLVLVCVVFLALTLAENGRAEEKSLFVHPGVLHTRAELDFVKSMVAAGSCKSSFSCML